MASQTLKYLNLKYQMCCICKRRADYMRYGSFRVVNEKIKAYFKIVPVEINGVKNGVICRKHLVGVDLKSVSNNIACQSSDRNENKKTEK